MKEKILARLKESAGEYISGEDMSRDLGVSRTAIWKYVRELKAEGYIICSSSKKGYMLVGDNDVLSAFEISYGLCTKVLGSSVFFFDELDSTNLFAKKIAHEGCEDGAVVVADRQTKGRGRLGRNWASASKKGVWMSVVLRPLISPANMQIITLGASVAVVNALKKSTGIGTGIKWPNDIILDGKKVCGILTEMSSEPDVVNFIVLGIGINVNHSEEDFPDELKSTAISLKSYAEKAGNIAKPSNGGRFFKRSEIIKSVLFEMETIYQFINDGAFSEIIRQWKEFSLTLGKKVKLSMRDGEYTGIAKDVTGEGKLLVQCDDGALREVASGEVMVRGILGYV